MMNQATFIDPAKMNAGKVLFKIVKYAINMHVIARIWLYIRKYPWHHDEYKETYNYKEQTLLYRCKLYIYIYIFKDNHSNVKITAHPNMSLQQYHVQSIHCMK
jgi:hypothetical protein